MEKMLAIAALEKKAGEEKEENGNSILYQALVYSINYLEKTEVKGSSEDD